MEFKGTSGKWFWIEGKRHDLAILQSENFEEVCNFGNDYDFYPTEGTEPNKYDKLLISKAPDLLEFINRMRNHWCDSGLTETALDNYMAEAKQLIKEATEL